MSENAARVSPSKSFWWIAGFALLWNVIGILTYVASVTISAEALAAMQPAERVIYENVPMWATSAYAIAVNGGAIGCVLLLLRSTWAVPVFIVSLVAVVVQFFHAFFMTELLALRGASSAILPIVITLIGVFEIWYAREARKKGWIS